MPKRSRHSLCPLWQRCLPSQHTRQKATRQGIQYFCLECPDEVPTEETEYAMRQREYQKTKQERRKRKTMEHRIRHR
jgi:hypothetical protein